MGAMRVQKLCPLFKIMLAAFLALTMCGCAVRHGPSAGCPKPPAGARVKGWYNIDGYPCSYYILESAEGFKEKGLASWYGPGFQGNRTANGEIYDMNKVSAAHKHLPLHTWVRVRNLENRKSLVLRINDRGPFVLNRVIDLSRAAAEKLGVLGPGVAPVSLTAITGAEARRLSAAEKKPLSRSAPAAAKRVAAQSGPFRLQVSSTTDPYQAESIADRLRNEFSPVSLGSAHRNGSTTFYIYIEGLKSRREARKLQAHLTRRGYRNVQVVSR